MFKRKKKKNNMPIMYDYTKWNEDFGFLILIITKKLANTKDYNIKILGSQLQKSYDFIKDTDISSEYQRIVEEIYDTLSDSYKNFLVLKYFKNDKKLIEFISETVLDDLIKSSIDANNEKINRQYSKEMTQAISKMNYSPKKEK